MRRRSGARTRRWRGQRATPIADELEREYFDLFVGVGRGELLPYGSYYLTGFLNERPLARLREDLARARHRARRRTITSPRITRPCCARSWRGLIGGQFPGDGRSGSAQIFEKHLAPWIGRFFADLETRQSGQLLSRCRHARAAVSSKSKAEAFALSRVNGRARTGRTRHEGRRQDHGRTPRILSGARRVGAAAVAVAPLATEAKADSETNDEKRKARYKVNRSTSRPITASTGIRAKGRRPC